MEIEAFIKKMKDIYLSLIDYIDEIDDLDVKFEILLEILENNAIKEKKEEIRLLFQLISNIADNHHQTSDFFYKLEKIFQYLIKDNHLSFFNFISNYTNYNRQILSLLLEKEFIKPDKSFLKKYLQNQPNELNLNKINLLPLFYYLYHKMKKFLEEEKQKQIEDEILKKCDVDLSTFEKKCQNGQNDSYICSLIRSDSVEEFVAYVNRTNLSLTSKIKPSIYETNSFLINKEPTLI